MYQQAIAEDPHLHSFSCSYMNHHLFVRNFTLALLPMILSTNLYLTGNGCSSSQLGKTSCLHNTETEGGQCVLIVACQCTLVCTCCAVLHFATASVTAKINQCGNLRAFVPSHERVHGGPRLFSRAIDNLALGGTSEDTPLGVHVRSLHFGCAWLSRLDWGSPHLGRTTKQWRPTGANCWG